MPLYIVFVNQISSFKYSLLSACERRQMLCEILQKCTKNTAFTLEVTK
ncbi:MAG: hypothetical protein ACI810_001627 [Gammaproteobacteria bacterium]|jgi:hypothetical protein